MIKHFGKNTAGNDYVVGDIHGCFSRLQASLDAIEFNPEKDRLFSVGDLVDRGPESEQVVDWIAKPWFHAVRGNHDDFAIRHVRNGHLDFENYTRNGGAWFIALPRDEQLNIVDALESLPFAISVDTDCGLIGIVHADNPLESWPQLVETLSSGLSRSKTKPITDLLMWSRERAESKYQGVCEGVTHLIVGHTSVTNPCQLGNVVYIDTMGWRDGDFTLMKIQGQLALSKTETTTLND